jgi:hypothetical protein
MSSAAQPPKIPIVDASAIPRATVKKKFRGQDGAATPEAIQQTAPPARGLARSRRVLHDPNQWPVTLKMVAPG